MEFYYFFLAKNAVIVIVVDFGFVLEERGVETVRFFI